MAGVDGDVLVIGAGLAGCLAALALRDQGLAVTMVAPPQRAVASYCSYGGIPGWAVLPGRFGEAMLRAPESWRALEQRHGSLGWQPCALSLHWSEAEAEAASPLVERLQAQVPGARLQSQRLILPFGRVDGLCLAQALPLALERCGIRRLQAAVASLEPLTPQGWQLILAGGGQLQAPRVLLAAGPASTGLWPPLAQCRPPAVGMSWSGALALEAGACAPQDLPAGAAEGIVIPLLGQRQALEGRCSRLERPEWIVDAGLAPHGDGWWLGQITVVAPSGAACPAPDPIWMEAELRRQLRAVWPRLADLPGRLVVVPVGFPGADGPLCGAVDGASGLWGWAGMPGSFALLPVLAPGLASAMAGTL
ncbi:MAG: FAD-dependent oxidoreductase [Cyanobacteria bacterium]|nr:FAD-dependent oxidoreductase [Cyanobacteriota bacterium]